MLVAASWRAPRPGLSQAQGNAPDALPPHTLEQQGPGGTPLRHKPLPYIAGGEGRGGLLLIHDEPGTCSLAHAGNPRSQNGHTSPAADPSPAACPPARPRAPVPTLAPLASHHTIAPPLPPSFPRRRFNAVNARYKFLGEFANDTVVNSTYPAWQELAFWRLYMPLNGSEAGRLVGGPLLFDLLQSVDATVAAVQSGTTVGGEGWEGW